MTLARPPRGNPPLPMHSSLPQQLLNSKKPYLSIRHPTLEPLDKIKPILTNLCSNTSCSTDFDSEEYEREFSRKRRVSGGYSQDLPINNNNNPISINETGRNQKLPALSRSDPSIVTPRDDTDNFGISSTKADIHHNNNSTINNQNNITFDANSGSDIKNSKNSRNDSGINNNDENDTFASEPAVLTKFHSTTSPMNRTSVGFSNANCKHIECEKDGPIIDTEVPGVIRLASAREVSHADLCFAKLPPLPQISDPMFSPILFQKLEICSQVLDFSAPNAQLTEKETKARTLCELIELFENSRDIQKLDIKQQEAVFKMIEVNIFRQDPIYPVTSLTLDFSISVIEPSWPHLFYCYQIINRFIQVFPKSEYMNMQTTKHAIYLTQLPDTNERMQIVAFLRTYFDTHPEDRRATLKAVESQLLDLVDGQATPFCAMPLIILLTHMFARSHNQFMNEYIHIHKHAILPLIGLPYLPMYHQNLRQLVGTILTNIPSLTLHSLREIELMWPMTNGSKQHQILEILVFIFSKMPQNLFKPISNRVFQFLAICVESLQSKVCETTLEIWVTATPENWVGVNSRAGIHAMYENVSNVSEKHWNKSNLEKAQQAMIAMCKINKHSYLKMKNYQKQLKAQRYRPRIPNDCQRGWASIARKAAELGMEFNLNHKLKEFHDLFHNEKKLTLEVSRFIPRKIKDVENAEKIAKEHL